MSTIDTFIQFINDNWNQKVTVYQSDTLPGYTPGTVVDPNDYNGEPVFGMQSNIFFDVESNSIYYYTEGSEPWKKFGDTLSTSFGVPDAVNVGIDVGHIDRTETSGDLSGLTLSDIIGKLLFKEYQPEKIDPFVDYTIKSNAVNITDSWFEVGSTIPVTFDATTDFGKWYIPKLELSTSNYALGFNTTPYTYEKKISGTYTPITEQDVIVEQDENLFRVKANLKGVHARITNFGNIVTGYEENPTAIFSTSWVEKKIYGGYYLFIGSSINPDIITMDPRSFISLFEATSIYTGTKQFKVSTAQKYIVVYMMGNKVADSSYKLNRVSEGGDIIESSIKFNQIPELVQIALPNGTNVTYTRHVMKYIQPVSTDMYFQLTV